MEVSGAAGGQRRADRERERARRERGEQHERGDARLSMRGFLPESRQRSVPIPFEVPNRRYMRFRVFAWTRAAACKQRPGQAWSRKVAFATSGGSGSGALAPDGQRNAAADASGQPGDGVRAEPDAPVRRGRAERAREPVDPVHRDLAGAAFEFLENVRARARGERVRTAHLRAERERLLDEEARRWAWASRACRRWR